ncbi:hypothetical protein [Metapseudomonas otitidis]|uniref:hypothetical protein n=1 Tax=Metapseudomonas otitidis TaxID=319939 RepID=UPI00244C6600|nr:hypothetical protein [Pseudomonas otitidis]MDG9784632.1 hypothetical protein [Pseudomonas otitidis]
MKKMLLMGLLLASGSATAETVLVRFGIGQHCVGDTFQMFEPVETLFNDRKCELPLAHGNDMRAYVLRTKTVALKGCWGQLMSGDYLIVDQTGNQQTVPHQAYMQATTNSDGTAKITSSPIKTPEWAKAAGYCP